LTREPGTSKSKPPARVHPDDRGRIEGLNALAALIQGAPQQKTPISYYTPILIQCTLPHSDPKTSHWIKTNGDFSLIVSSGVDRHGQSYGIPYGSFPRLVLAYIITVVTQTGERRVDLSSHFSGFGVCVAMERKPGKCMLLVPPLPSHAPQPLVLLAA
jgi:hypothetical protein